MHSPLTPIYSPNSTYYALIHHVSDNDIYVNTKYHRQRMDPWDLENYDYVRRHLSFSPDRTSTPSATGEPISSNFFYLPNISGECPACCAGMDEQPFYNAKYDTVLDDELSPCCYTDIESGSGENGDNNSRSSTESSPECNSSCGTSSVSSLILHTPRFGAATSSRRRLVLPKPAPRLQFPAPPPYNYCLSPGSCSAVDNNYYSLSLDCYECLSAAAAATATTNTNSRSNIPLYAQLSGGGVGVSSDIGRKSSIHSFNTYASNKFGFSKKGLLKIDYSCNWNDLNRYITTKVY